MSTMEWVHCNKCMAQVQCREIALDLFFLNCSHVICSRCIGNREGILPGGQCPKCHRKAASIMISNEMGETVRYFKDPQETIKQMEKTHQQNFSLLENSAAKFMNQVCGVLRQQTQEIKLLQSILEFQKKNQAALQEIIRQNYKKKNSTIDTMCTKYKQLDEERNALIRQNRELIARLKQHRPNRSPSQFMDSELLHHRGVNGSTNSPDGFQLSRLNETLSFPAEQQRSLTSPDRITFVGTSPRVRSESPMLISPVPFLRQCSSFQPGRQAAAKPPVRSYQQPEMRRQHSLGGFGQPSGFFRR